MNPVLPGLVRGGSPDRSGATVYNIREDFEQKGQIERVVNAMIVDSLRPAVVWRMIVAVVQHRGAKGLVQRSISRVRIDAGDGNA